MNAGFRATTNGSTGMIRRTAKKGLRNRMVIMAAIAVTAATSLLGIPASASADWWHVTCSSATIRRDSGGGDVWRGGSSVVLMTVYQGWHVWYYQMTMSSSWAV